MMSLFAVLLAAATAEAAPLTFEAGKTLPLAPGSWSISASPAGTEARFGIALVLRCDRATRTITIVRPGTSPSALTITTSEMTRTLSAGGRLSVSDPLLDAIAFSRGRFLVSGGGATLVIPSWPEAARSIEDCRS